MLYEGSLAGLQPNINQIMERTGVSRRAAVDYLNAMRRINISAQSLGRNDPNVWVIERIAKAILRYAPRDSRPTLRRVRSEPSDTSLDLVNIAEMPLVSHAHIAVKELRCPGPAKQRMTWIKCPFDDLTEKEQRLCEKCQLKEQRPVDTSLKLTELKATVSIVTEREAFERSVLKCAEKIRRAGQQSDD